MGEVGGEIGTMIYMYPHENNGPWSDLDQSICTQLQRVVNGVLPYFISLLYQSITQIDYIESDRIIGIEIVDSVQFLFFLCIYAS